MGPATYHVKYATRRLREYVYIPPCAPVSVKGRTTEITRVASVFRQARMQDGASKEREEMARTRHNVREKASFRQTLETLIKNKEAIGAVSGAQVVAKGVNMGSGNKEGMFAAWGQGAGGDVEVLGKLE